jgi:hypothetical protein
MHCIKFTIGSLCRMHYRSPLLIKIHHVSSMYVISQNSIPDKKFLILIILHLSIFYYLNREL